MATPWLDKRSFAARFPYLIYDVFLLAVVFYILICYTYTIMTTYISFQDLCGLGVSTSNYMCGALVTIHLLLFRHRLKRLTDSLDSIAAAILKSGLGQEVFFIQLYTKNSKLISTLVNVSVFFSALAPSMYCFSVPTMDWFRGEYGTRFPVLIVSPFDDRQPGVYEFIFFLVVCCMCVSIGKKVTTDCLFISLLKIEITFLKYLSKSVSGLKKEFLNGNNALVGKKLIFCVRLHQSILRSTEELITIFSPVIVIYYLTVICIVVCGTFVQIMKDNENIIQSLTIGSFVMTTLVYHFLLANTSNELTTEAQNLTLVAYDLPWYLMSREEATLVQMMMSMSSRPVLLTAYRAPIFILNRENFGSTIIVGCICVVFGERFRCDSIIFKAYYADAANNDGLHRKFVVSAISAFVTFCQMKTLYD